MASIYGTVGSLKDTFQPNITLERPEGAESMHPSSARALYRTNTYSTYTSGFCDGYGQSNIIIIPKEFADDFEEFCHKNHGPLPLLYRSKPGEVGAPPLAENSNIRLVKYICIQWNPFASETIRTYQSDLISDVSCLL